MTFENTLLVNNMSHKSMFNPPFSAIFFDTFYGFLKDGNYLLGIILLYLESIHSFGMWVYKFVKLSSLGSTTNMLLGDLWYAKLNVHCFPKCDEFFCNRIKSRSINKKKWNNLFIYCWIIMFFLESFRA
jgi:hypothetical protein